MKVTFDTAIRTGFVAFDELRKSVEDKGLFDYVVEQVKRERLVADIAKGIVKSKRGLESKFAGYDWAEHYTNRPDHVFNDFFRAYLANKYSRVSRGLPF